MCSKVDDSYCTVLMDWGCGMCPSGRELSPGVGFCESVSPLIILGLDLGLFGEKPSSILESIYIRVYIYCSVRFGLGISLHGCILNLYMPLKNSFTQAKSSGINLGVVTGPPCFPTVPRLC